MTTSIFKDMYHFKLQCMITPLSQVYHISRNTWFKMETRMIKNVCAPAVVLGERIVIVGGKFGQRSTRQGANLASPMEIKVTSRQMLFYKTDLVKSLPSSQGGCAGQLDKVLFSSRSFSLSLSANRNGITPLSQRCCDRERYSRIEST